MRILRSIRSVNPEDGGPIEGIKQVSRIHWQQGHEVEMVSLDSPDDPWVKTFAFPVHALGPVKGKFGFNIGLPSWIRGNAERFDAVIINGIWQFSSLGVFLGLRGSRTPYFVFPHGMLDPWFKSTYPLKHLKKWMYWPWGEYWVLRQAHAVCFTCEEERRLARQSFWLYRCRERVVNYGTAAPDGQPAAQKEIFLSRFPELRGKRIWLFLGRLHPKKGCDVLLRAMASVCKSPEAASTHLVMTGPDQTGWLEKLRNLAHELGIAGRVTWSGMLGGDLKAGALRSAEVLVLPSHQENFGIAVVEALACGVPVLISNKVNIWREIEQDQAGLVENDDVNGVSRLLSRWLGLSCQEKDGYRARAEECFLKRFEIHKAAESLIDVLKRGEKP